MADRERDDPLLVRVKKSDREAFRLLFEHYQPIVFRQMLFQTHDSDTAHEIVQETFVRIWDHRARLKVGRSFLAYTLRISGNILRDLARHRAMRERVAVPPPALSEGDDPGEALQLALLEEKIARIINSELPERCRRVFFLSRFEGKSHREIASTLGVSTKTVENQISRALKTLRKRLGDLGTASGGRTR